MQGGKGGGEEPREDEQHGLLPVPMALAAAPETGRALHLHLHPLTKEKRLWGRGQEACGHRRVPVPSVRPASCPPDPPTHMDAPNHNVALVSLPPPPPPIDHPLPA